MKNYKDLDIYRISYDLAVKVHRFALKLPQYEMYEEGSQVRRSSKGITSCIVEGYGRRKYKAEFVKFLVYAHSICDETILHVNFIIDSHQTMAGEFEPLGPSYEELSRKIHKYIQYVEESWNRDIVMEKKRSAPL